LQSQLRENGFYSCRDLLLESGVNGYAARTDKRICRTLSVYPFHIR